jgi:Family of unknown function (DUF5320)
MPRGDRTGPLGMGAMTGRAAGYCTGSGAPGYAQSGPGRGFGAGLGRSRGAWSKGSGGGGRGRRNMFHATGLPGWQRFGWNAASYMYPTPYARQPDPAMEKQALKSHADALQAELDAIKKRLTEIETIAAADSAVRP